MSNLSDPKKALIIGVGAEKGLGASVSARFAREGFHVFVAGRTSQSLDLVVRKIRGASDGRRARPAAVNPS